MVLLCMLSINSDCRPLRAITKEVEKQQSDEDDAASAILYKMHIQSSLQGTELHKMTRKAKGRRARWKRRFEHGVKSRQQKRKGAYSRQCSANPSSASPCAPKIPGLPRTRRTPCQKRTQSTKNSKQKTLCLLSMRKRRCKSFTLARMS